MGRALIAVSLVLPLAFAAEHTKLPPADPAPVLDYRVVASYPHDPQAYTQGLLFYEGRLYESTGRESELRELRLESGEIVRKVELDDEYFGEGLARWGDRLIQLTWKAGTAFVYDIDSLRRLRRFSYSGEGWGLTQDDSHLIMSDGSATLRFLDPDSFEVQRRVRVTDGALPVDALNELEYVRGEIYANVYRSERIARIDPRSGRVVAWIDLAGLLDPEEGAGVLNGIAYDATGGRLFVTGKYWPRLFEIEPRP
ncbi:MAG: glutaminyl-peptide cyclotransferase [Halofilum sp. (in: g-proteobacteria)]